jgi:hypothetical protein
VELKQLFQHAHGAVTLRSMRQECAESCGRHIGARGSLSQTATIGARIYGT